jgi:predicted transcriptional regulator
MGHDQRRDLTVKSRHPRQREASRVDSEDGRYANKVSDHFNNSHTTRTLAVATDVSGATLSIEMGAAKKTVGVRTDPEDIARLDELAATIGRTSGLDVTRGDAARAALRRGLDELEKQHNIVKKGVEEVAKPAKSKK